MKKITYIGVLLSVVMILTSCTFANIKLPFLSDSATQSPSSEITPTAAMQAKKHNPSVVDNAKLLTDKEIDNLNDMLDRISYTYNLDVSIYTEEVMQQDNAQDAADNIYDNNNYGIGESSDGILLYISKSPRNYHITTTGKAIQIFTQPKLLEIDNNILDYLKNNKYYDAFWAYGTTVEKLLN